MWGRTPSAPRVSDRFTARRRARRQRIAVALIILIALSGAGIAYELRQAVVRIADITVLGADQSLSDIAAAQLQGDYLGIIPRDSIFFFPASRIRAGIMATHPNIAAVSVARTSLTGISVRPSYRVPIARWCGTSLASTPAADAASAETMPAENCYLFDANGLLYALAVPGDNASTTEATSSPDKTVTPFVLFSPLESDGVPAIHQTLKDADELPGVFDFARQIGTLGSAVGTIVIRGDEVDFFLASSTARITYLLGDEQNAFTAFVSAKDQLNPSDPMLEYADLRFPGKIYVKRSEAPKESK